MLQSMGSQRVRRDRVTDKHHQQQSLADSVSSESDLSGSQMSVFSLCSHVVEEVRAISLWGLFYKCTNVIIGASGGSVVKNLPANAGDTRDTGRSPGRGNSNLLQYSCRENLTDRGACQSMGSQRLRHD